MIMASMQQSFYFNVHAICAMFSKLRPSLQGGRATQVSGLTLAVGQKIARVHKQNFTGRVETQRVETRVGRLTHIG